jgi:20S proteasome alpha/beta subunit
VWNFLNIVRTRERKPVTIILALRCKNSIVVAADSRTTDNDERRDDAEKAHLVQLQDVGVIVAASGSDDSSSVVVESVKRLAGNLKLASDDAPGGLLADAFREYRNNLIASTYGTMAEFKNSMLRDGVNCELLTAYYFRGAQKIYTADLERGVPVPRSQDHWALGVGRHIANYLVGSFDVAKMDTQQAIFTAIYVVDEVKAVVPGCGGPTQIAIIDSKNKPEKLSAESIREREHLADELRQKRAAALSAMRSNINEAAITYVAQPWGSNPIVPVED